jgi:hypothetical protein
MKLGEDLRDVISRINASASATVGHLPQIAGRVASPGVWRAFQISLSSCGSRRLNSLPWARPSRRPSQSPSAGRVSFAVWVSSPRDPTLTRHSHQGTRLRPCEYGIDVQDA